MMPTVAAAVTERMRQAWEATEYNAIATREVLVSELLAREVDVRCGERVLDVASGTGNTALAVARRGGRVTASDFSAAQLRIASERAAVEGLELEVEVADAQSLPFPDDSFDVVLSTFGVMYAPDQQRAADELTRVCRPGGRIGLVSWVPDGRAGRVQALVAARLPAPPHAGPPPPAPTLWGTEEHCRALFGTRVSELRSTVHTHEFCAASAEAYTSLLHRHLPWRVLFAALEPAELRELLTAVAAEWEGCNRATDGTFVGCIPYLQLVATAG